MTVEGIHGFVQAYAPVPISPVLQPPPAAAAAEVAALPAAGTFGSLTREVEDERLLSAFLAAQVKIMQDIVKSACMTNTFLYGDAADEFQDAYYNLSANKYPPDKRPTIPGYDPDSALKGLDDCAYDLMFAFLRSPSRGTQYLNYNGAPVLQKYHPAAAPIRYGRSAPRQRPDPCFVYDGVRFCPGQS